MRAKIIPYDDAARILAKAQAYMCDLDALIKDGERAIDLLIKAIDSADDDLRLRIVLMLGATATEQVIRPLYRMMTDGRYCEALRHAAAVQLSLIGPKIVDSEVWVGRLVADLGRGDSFLRAAAAFALGWEGNYRAIIPLVNALNDPDFEVQQAAVSALTNIKEEQIFGLLTQHLISGSKEQQRCILYHLSCFSQHRAKVVGICTQYLSHPDAELRYDALIVLDAVCDPEKPLQLYLQCLKDPDPRIREVALVYLATENRAHLQSIEPEVRSLINDPVSDIRQAAIRLHYRICGGPTAIP